MSYSEWDVLRTVRNEPVYPGALITIQRWGGLAVVDTPILVCSTSLISHRFYRLWHITALAEGRVIKINLRINSGAHESLEIVSY